MVIVHPDNTQLEVLRDHRPPPNASIIELWQFLTSSRIRIVIRIVAKMELIGPWAMPYPSK